jgi:hypothetical protein
MANNMAITNNVRIHWGSRAEANRKKNIPKIAKVNSGIAT